MDNTIATWGFLVFGFFLGRGVADLILCLCHEFLSFCIGKFQNLAGK